MRKLLIVVALAVALDAFCALKADAQMKAVIPPFCSSAASTVVVGQSETWTGSREINGWVCVRGVLTLQGALTATGIYVDEGGMLDVVSGASFTVRDSPIAATDLRQWGNGLIVFGRVRMVGIPKTPYVRLTAEPLAGASTLTLPVPADWAVGDEVFLPDTRQVPPESWFVQAYALQHEYRTITAKTATTVTLSAPLTFSHRGARDANGALTRLADGATLLPHVANLTRSITVRSQNPNGTRGHTVYSDRASVEIRYVAFRDLGRTTTDPVSDVDNSPNQIGRYPIHVHMHQGPVNPTNTGYQFQIIGNVVRDSRKWPVAIHGSHFGLVEGNVIVGGAQLTGAGLALEDGSETENLIRGNFVADIRGHMNPRNSGSDTSTPGSGGECIWAAGFNNRFVNNVVTGCRNAVQQIVSGVGFKFFVPPYDQRRNQPTVRGADATQTTSALLKHQPLLQFDGNEAYGLIADGITFWHLGTDGGGWNASQAVSLMRDFTVWHAYEGMLYCYPCARLTFERPVYRIDPAQVHKPAAFVGGDYRVVDLVVRDGDIHAGSATGQLIDLISTARFERNRVTAHGAGFRFETPAKPGGDASRPNGVAVELDGNVVTPWPGQPLRTVATAHNLTRHNTHATEPYTIHVRNHQGGAGDDFRLCFEVQATTSQYYGGACPSATTREGVQGVVIATSTPPPPPPPPPVDCVVSEWSAWTAWAPIDATTEQRSRTRTILTPPANGGAACPALTETATRAIVVEPPPPPPPTDPCVSDPLRVSRISWPTTNTGRRSITFDVGTKRWVGFSFTWPGVLIVTDTRGCTATVTR